MGGFVPWLLTGGRVEEPLEPWAAFRVLGALLLAAGIVVVVHAFVRFVVEGSGTPAPIAPTERLVVGGAFRHVRNPMYVAVTAVIAGQALLLGQIGLLAYAAAFWVLVASFVRFHEEPALRRRFGRSYEEYRAAVPAWWPRLRPWRSS